MIRALCLCLVLALPAGAQTDPTITAARAAAMLDLASTRLAEAQGARDRVAALSETIRAFEEGLIATREALRRSEARETAILTRLEAEREQLANMLAAAQAIASSPPPLLLLHPDGPEGAARSAMIISDVTPALAQATNALRAQLQDLATMRELQDTANADLTAALEDVQTARAALSEAIADRVTLPPRIDSDPAVIRQLLEAASSLETLTEALNDNPVGPLPNALSIEMAHGALDLPVFGQTLRGFNEADAAGITSPGLILATRPNALVTAPWRGTIRFAGALPDQGLVILLETDPEHLLVLAGLGTAYVTTGEIVDTAAPIGLMDLGLSTSENLIVPGTEDAGLTLSETLYIELRVNNTPVDPAPWFADHRR